MYNIFFELFDFLGSKVKSYTFHKIRPTVIADYVRTADTYVLKTPKLCSVEIDVIFSFFVN